MHLYKYSEILSIRFIYFTFFMYKVCDFLTCKVKKYRYNYFCSRSPRLAQPLQRP